MPDIWSYCGECERWYYCLPGSGIMCPVCESEPSASEDRAAPAGLRAGATLVRSAQS